MEKEIWLTNKEAQDYYGVHRNTIHNWRAKGVLETRKTMIGKMPSYEYLKSEALLEYINERKVIDNRWNK